MLFSEFFDVHQTLPPPLLIKLSGVYCFRCVRVCLQTSTFGLSVTFDLHEVHCSYLVGVYFGLKTFKWHHIFTFTLWPRWWHLVTTYFIVTFYAFPRSKFDIFVHVWHYVCITQFLLPGYVACASRCSCGNIVYAVKFVLGDHLCKLSSLLVVTLYPVLWDM